MYAYISGKLTALHPTHIIVETTSGIGYEIQTPNSYRFQKLRSNGESVYVTHCT